MAGELLHRARARRALRGASRTCVATHAVPRAAACDGILSSRITQGIRSISLVPISLFQDSSSAAPPAFREQLVGARRGQGVFRSNVLLREGACRVTGVDEPRHLKARHIKPWRHASDRGATRWRERPVAVASHRSPFDEGYITFSSSQQLAIVPEVRDTLLDAWGIELSRYSHRRPDISGTANVGSWPRSRLTSAWRAFRSSPLATLSTATALTSSPGRRCRCARPRPWPRRRRAASGALTGR
jgi:hypothetical protein